MGRIKAWRDREEASLLKHTLLVHAHRCRSIFTTRSFCKHVSPGRGQKTFGPLCSFILHLGKEDGAGFAQIFCCGLQQPDGDFRFSELGEGMNFADPISELSSVFSVCVEVLQRPEPSPVPPTTHPRLPLLGCPADAVKRSTAAVLFFPLRLPYSPCGR